MTEKAIGFWGGIIGACIVYPPLTIGVVVVFAAAQALGMHMASGNVPTAKAQRQIRGLE